MVKPDRNILLLLDIQLNNQLFSTLTVDFEALIHISRSVEADDCVLEMSEDVLLFNFNLASSLLLVVIESIMTIWTNNRILILWTNILEVENLTILEVIQPIPSNKGYPVILGICK